MFVREIPACLACIVDYFGAGGGGCDTVWFGRKLVLLGSAQLVAKSEPLSFAELPADLNTGIRRS